MSKSNSVRTWYQINRHVEWNSGHMGRVSALLDALKMWWHQRPYERSRRNLLQ